jgi:glyoxylase-like metal-dependent hydrolase (beta-lactamase superfamily II)
MTVYPLSEGTFTIGFDKVFMPFNSADVLEDRPRGSLLVEVQPFLLVTEKDRIILDTGLGFSGLTGRPQIHEALEKHGFSPGDITKVLLSHLHKDHAGGLMHADSNGALIPSFPYACYYIYRPEVDAMFTAGYPSYHTDEITPLFDQGKLNWLEGMDGTIDGYIRWWHTGGHSPQHIVFLIDEGGEKVFFGGDEAPQAKQMKVKYIAKYDTNGKRAMELREAWAAQGKREGWQILFYHDVATPALHM